MMEASLQQTCQPQLNWPWINSLLKTWNIGRQHYGLLQPEPHRTAGQKLLRRYRHRAQKTQVRFLSQRLHNYVQIFTILYHLGSDSRQKFDCSRVLRSVQTDTEFCFLLWRLCRTMNEPFRSRQITTSIDITVPWHSAAATKYNYATDYPG